MSNPSIVPTPASLTSNARTLAIRCTSDVKDFAISAEPAMPVIQLEVAVAGITPELTTTTMFEWTATLDFDPTQCLNGIPASFPPLVLHGVSTGGAFALRFPELRGGRLTVRTKATIAGVEILGER